MNLERSNDSAPPLPHALVRAANLFLGGLAAAALLLVGYCALHPEKYARFGLQIALIFGGLGTLAVASLVSRLASERMRVNVFLLLLSMGTGVYGAALFQAARQTDPLERLMQEAARTGRPYDTRSKLDVVNALREQGVDAYPGLIPAVLREPDESGRYHSLIEIGGEEVMLLAGVSRKPTVLCNESGEYGIYEADEHGFNNPAGIWGSRRIDIVAVGDSFVHGACVSGGADVVSWIRQQVANALNLGFSGNSPLYSLATLIEYAAPLEPRTLLWVYFHNDLAPYELGIDRETPLLLRYLEEDFSQGLGARQSEVDRVLSSWLLERIKTSEPKSAAAKLAEARGTFTQRIWRILMLSDLRNLLLGAANEDYNRWEPDLAFYERVLRRAQEVVARWNGELIFVYMPAVEELNGFRLAYGGTRQAVLSLARGVGLRVVDLHAELAAHPNPETLYTFPAPSRVTIPHFTPEGYALVARRILAALQ